MSRPPTEIEQQVAELIASYEIAMERLVSREKKIEENVELSEHFLNEQLDKINALMADLREVMTEAGAARMRLSIQEALKMGNLQVQEIKRIGEETRTMMRDSCQRFERTSLSTIKNVNEAINAVNLDELKKFVENSYAQIKSHSADAISKISSIFRGFQWKNLIFALSLSLMTSVIIGLYLNAEWPWEIHQTIVKERTAGKAVMNAWPHLSKTDQAYLEQKILKISKND